MRLDCELGNTHSFEVAGIDGDPRRLSSIHVPFIVPSPPPSPDDDDTNSAIMYNKAKNAQRRTILAALRKSQLFPPPTYPRPRPSPPPRPLSDHRRRE